MTNDRQSLYKNIKEQVKGDITGGVLQPGDRLPTEAELSRKHKVSRITITKALTELKQEGYIERYPSRGSFVAENLPQAAGQGGYESTALNIGAAEQGARFEIALIIPRVTDVFSLNIVSGISRALPKDKFSLVIRTSRDNQGESYAIKRCVNGGVSGIILFPVDQEFYSDQVLAMKVFGFPFVLIDRFFPGIDTSYIISDNKTAGALACEHLITLGHKRIGFVSYSHRMTYSVEERINGYTEKLAEHGFSDCLFVYDQLNTADGFESGAQLVTQMRAQGYTGIIASESGSALYLYNVMGKMGLQMPRDMSIISFDNPLSGLEANGIFTHIDQQEYSMGERAATLLRHILESGDATPQTQILAPRVIQAKTTAPPGKTERP